MMFMLIRGTSKHLIRRIHQVKYASLPKFSIKAANEEDEREKEMIYTSKKQMNKSLELEKLLPPQNKTVLQ